MSALIALGLLLAFAAPLRADRNDDRDDRRPEKREQGEKQPRIAPQIEHRAEQPPRREAREPRVEPGRVPRPEAPPGQVRREAAREPSRNSTIAGRIQQQPPKPGYVYDTRHKHNHYYPPAGYVEPKAPIVSRIVQYRNVNYHYHNGVWYRPHGTRFIVVLPPVGVIVPVLPPFYTTVWVGTVPYYYAGGVYYTWQPEHRSYVVAEAPPEAQVREALNGGVSDSIFIYPKQGQNEPQQAKDRYECHRWAVDQTGFDPTQSGGGVPEAQHAGKRTDYNRAMKACLEARGYSVQ
jgi:hypothetical protein